MPEAVEKSRLVKVEKHELRRLVELAAAGLGSSLNNQSPSEQTRNDEWIIGKIKRQLGIR
ncbi:MAG TPA: hypothetical protein VLF41_02780 [Candidatus Nanoarchaeia archaeon]|nr:hypothetical protein [Candidatus Nanoarchaeia archaeon]